MTYKTEDIIEKMWMEALKKAVKKYLKNAKKTVIMLVILKRNKS